MLQSITKITCTHTLCFWASFLLFYSKAAWTLLCMFKSKQQLSELCYCLGLFIEGQRTIILKVHEGSKTNRLRPSWVNLEANLPHYILYTQIGRASPHSLLWLENACSLKKINILFSLPDDLPFSYTSDDPLQWKNDCSLLLDI